RRGGRRDDRCRTGAARAGRRPRQGLCRRHFGRQSDMSAAMTGAPHVFLVAGEESGDRLGAALIAAIRKRVPEARFSGVGGTHMAAEGVVSVFPLGDLAIVGIVAIAASLSKILARIEAAAAAVVAAKPDVLVIIDSPD